MVARSMTGSATMNALGGSDRQFGGSRFFDRLFATKDDMDRKVRARLGKFLSCPGIVVLFMGEGGELDLQVGLR